MTILVGLIMLIFLLGYGTFAVHFWKCGYKKSAFTVVGFSVAVCALAWHIFL